MEKKMLKAAVIGCGGRGRCVVGWMRGVSNKELQIVSAYDPDPEAIEKAKKEWDSPEMVSSSSMGDAIRFPGVDIVMIFSPNYLHCEAILDALSCGKRVFSEKPLATTLEDCRKIMDAEKKSGISITTGFVLRYSPFYRKIKELLDSGTFGKIINISASENREAFGGGCSMSADYGWRRYRSKGGPYLLEKCSHDLDLLNWFVSAVPNRVAAFSGLDYFVPANAHLWEKLGKETFSKLVEEKHRINPFSSEKDIDDNHALILEYPNGVKACFVLTLAAAIPERRMYINCTEGTIIGECFSGTLRYRRYTDPYETTLTFKGGGHGGGDEVMVHEVGDSLHGSVKPVSSRASNGFDCARVALAADLSARTGKIVSVEKA